MGMHMSKKKKKGVGVERLDSAKLTRQSMFDPTATVITNNNNNTASTTTTPASTTIAKRLSFPDEDQDGNPVNVQEVIQEVLQPRAIYFVAV